MTESAGNRAVEQRRDLRGAGTDHVRDDRVGRSWEGNDRQGQEEHHELRELQLFERDPHQFGHPPQATTRCGRDGMEAHGRPPLAVGPLDECERRRSAGGSRHRQLGLLKGQDLTADPRSTQPRVGQPFTGATGSTGLRQPTGRKGLHMQVCQARERYVRWLLVTKDLSPHTIRAYESDIAAFERYLGIRALVDRIDQDRLIAFMEEQRAAGLSSTSIRRRASGLRGFCRWLLSCSLLGSDPWVGTTVAVGRSRKLPRILPTHELDRLFVSLLKTARVDEMSDSDEVLHQPHESTTLLAVALMVATGVRVNEVVGVKCQDIDLPGRSLRILGKGQRERQVFLTNDWLTGLTCSYLKTRAALGLDHPYLLFNLHLTPLTPPAMRSRLVKAARDAGLRTRVTPHMLRHTAATQLIERGVDIRYIQRLLGHASLTTTEIYTHVSDRALSRVVSDADVLGTVLQLR